MSYLALGDSFTIGTGTTPAQAFPARWAARWGSRCEPRVENVAVNGYSTDDLIRDELPSLTTFRPTWVSLAVGANDIVRGVSLSHYRARLAAIFDAIRDAGVAADHIVVLPQPDWARSPTAHGFGDVEALGAQIRGFNDALSTEAKLRGARFVDLGALMKHQADSAELAPDGLHPSAVAYDAWAAALTEAVPDPCGG